MDPVVIVAIDPIAAVTTATDLAVMVKMVAKKRQNSRPRQVLNT